MMKIKENTTTWGWYDIDNIAIEEVLAIKGNVEKVQRISFSYNLEYRKELVQPNEKTLM